MRLKKFILESNHIERDGYIWNMAGSLLMAFQSVILLMVLTRTVGLKEAGIFTIAFANANLFMTIGKFGMRNFQISDIKEEYSFSEYLTSRWITSAVMLAVSILFVLYSAHYHSYAREKSMITLWMCILKMSDAIEDVFCGLLQQKNRLDIASKAMSIRAGTAILVFTVSLVIFKNQLQALTVTTIFTILVLILFTIWTCSSYFERKNKVHINSVLKLLKCCFPLFAGTFLAFYIGNAPKYAIDTYLSDNQQACYGFIAMPVFVIGLLNSFIFTPMLYQMSCLWNDRKIRTFVLKVFRQILLIILITIICLIGAYLIGIPVLSVLYHTDLGAYKTELLLLLTGGGFLGISGFLTTILTIMRYQKSILCGYGMVAILACVLSNPIVQKYSILGASLLYTLLMCALCICFSFLLLIILIKSKFQRILDIVEK